MKEYKGEDIAKECIYFKLDVEEEIFDEDNEKSCYNCKFRKWTSNSFICLKNKLKTDL